MNPDQLWETTMNPETRTLLQVQIEDAAKAERRVSTLMGDKVDPRKRWIIENVDFTEYENNGEDRLTKPLHYRSLVLLHAKTFRRIDEHLEQFLPAFLEEVVGDRFGRYSKYIIQDRAIPDVRDGLKPVQRRILYAMYDSGNTPDKPYRNQRKRSVMSWVTIIRMVTRRSMKVWCGWRSHGKWGICSSTVMATGVRWTMIRQQRCGIRKHACRPSRWSCCAISRSEPCCSRIILIIRRKNRSCCLPATRICWSTASAAFHPALQQKFRRIICGKSSMPASP